MKARRLGIYAVFLLACLLSVVILAPFFQVLLTSFLSPEGGFSLNAWYEVFLASQKYLLSFWRTLLLCVLIVVGQTALSVLAGLGFAKYRFRGKSLLFFLLLVVMVLPLQVTLVPNYRILGTLGLLDTYGALLLPAIFAPLGTFLMTQSFRAVPDDILEAARLDGANLFAILMKVLLPMNKNAVASVVLLSFLEAWNMVEQPIAYLKDFTRYPLSVSAAYVGAGDASIRLVCCLLALLPPLLLFLRYHRELVEGIAFAELKE